MGERIRRHHTDHCMRVENKQVYPYSHLFSFFPSFSQTPSVMPAGEGFTDVELNMILKCRRTDVDRPLNSCLLRYRTLPALKPWLQADTLADRHWIWSGQINRLEERGRWVKRITKSIPISPSVRLCLLLSCCRMVGCNTYLWLKCGFK